MALQWWLALIAATGATGAVVGGRVSAARVDDGMSLLQVTTGDGAEEQLLAISPPRTMVTESFSNLLASDDEDEIESELDSLKKTVSRDEEGGAEEDDESDGRELLKKEISRMSKHGSKPAVKQAAKAHPPKAGEKSKSTKSSSPTKTSPAHHSVAKHAEVTKKTPANKLSLDQHAELSKKAAPKKLSTGEKHAEASHQTSSKHQSSSQLEHSKLLHEKARGTQQKAEAQQLHEKSQGALQKAESTAERRAREKLELKHMHHMAIVIVIAFGAIVSMLTVIRACYKPEPAPFLPSSRSSKKSSGERHSKSKSAHAAAQAPKL